MTWIMNLPGNLVKVLLVVLSFVCWLAGWLFSSNINSVSEILLFLFLIKATEKEEKEANMDNFDEDE